MDCATFAPDAPDDAERRRLVALMGHFLTVSLDAMGSRPAGPPEGAVQLEALVDTGSSDACMDVTIAEQIGLKAVNQSLVEGIGGRIEAKIYMARIAVPEVGFDEIMPVYGVRLRRPTHTVLLGRSFLQNYSATFDGPTGVLHLVKSDESRASGAIEDDFAT